MPAYKCRLMLILVPSIIGSAVAIATVIQTTFAPAIAQNVDLRIYWQQTIESYQQKLDAARQQGEVRQEIGVLQDAGGAYAGLGQFEKAVELYSQALITTRKIADREREAIILFLLVDTHKKLGDVEGIYFLERQLKDSSDAETQAIILEKLGTAYWALRNFHQALENYQKYLQLARQLQQPDRERSGLSSLGLIYLTQSNYQQAISVLEPALALAQKNPQQTPKTELDKGEIYTRLGMAYYGAGNHNKSLTAYQESVASARASKIDDSIKNDYVLRATGNLAKYYSAVKDWENLIKLQEQRLALARNNNLAGWESQILEDFSKVYYWTNNYPRAIEFQKQALALNRSQGNNTAIRGDLSVMINLGFLQWRSGNLAEAETTLNESVKAYDTNRSIWLRYANPPSKIYDSNNILNLTLLSQIYDMLQQVLVSQNRSKEALEASEKGRARAFADLLINRLAPNPNSQIDIPPPNLEQIKQIAKNENTTIVQYSVLYEYKYTYDYRLYTYSYPPRQPTKLFIWVIKPTGEIAFREVALKTSLTQLVGDARNFIFARKRHARAGSDRASPLQELHELLIEPIANLLPTNPEGRVTFIPQDALFLVPFTALEDKKSTYLIDKHTILIAPSIQTIGLARRAKNQFSHTNKALVVGNPVMPEFQSKSDGTRQQLSSLPGAEKEAQAIAKILDTQPITGSQATKVAVVQQMPDARIIHLATHGLLDNGVGYLSSLAFGTSGKDSGFLTAREIVDFKLNAELVVLSACDTGRGEITGDGVIGLSRAFISAGVPSVVASLWKVSDESTAVLMQEFYQNLQRSSDKAKAMRQAMLTTREKFPEPYYWTAFTVIGIGDRSVSFQY